MRGEALRGLATYNSTDTPGLILRHYPSFTAEELLGAFHKIANRITVGVVIAALLIASALMMRIPRGQTLAIMGFIAAAVAGLYLIVSTFIQDKHDKEQAKLKGK